MKRRSILLSVLLAAPLCAGPIAGGPCANGTAAEYIALGSTGCIVTTSDGDTVWRDANIVLSGSATLPALSDLPVTVTVSSNYIKWNLGFQDIPEFSVTSGETLHFEWGFNVDAPTHARYYSANFAPFPTSLTAASLSGSADWSICEGGFLGTAACTDNGHVDYPSVSNTLGHTHFATSPSTTQFGMSISGDLNGPFAMHFIEMSMATGVYQSQAPEPSQLLGVGLAAVALLARVTAKRRSRES